MTARSDAALLITFAVAITTILLALGALRTAMIAYGVAATSFPALRLLTYGGLFSILAALAFLPAYGAWQERMSELRDALYPIPEDGRPTHEWFEARDDLDSLLATRYSLGRILTAVLSVLAPLVASLVSAILPGTA